MPPVSATITFSAEDPADLGAILAAIGEALRVVEGRTVEAGPGGLVAASTGESIDFAGWYQAHGRRFLERLQPNARKALLLIVREGPTVPFQRVRDELDMKGPKLAGTLASIGAAVSALNAPAPPFRADHKRQVYTIDPDVQAAMRGVA